MMPKNIAIPNSSTLSEINISVLALCRCFILCSFVHTRCTYSEGIAIRQKDEKRIRSNELIENNYLPSKEVESVSALDDLTES